MKYLTASILCLFFMLGTVSCKTLSTQDQARMLEDASQASRLSQKKNTPPQNTLIHDIGTIWNGTFIRHVFVIENNDAGPLEIRDVIEGQGVRIARFSRTVSPGEKAEIVFEVSTRRLKGKIRKTARVHFKGPERPPFELLVTGEVKTSVLVAPDKVVRFKNESVFDEAFDCYHEDTDLALRMIRLGLRSAWVPGAPCLHLGSASGNKRTWRHPWWILANRWRALAGNLSPLAFGLNFPRFFRGELRAVRTLTRHNIRAFPVSILVLAALPFIKVKGWLRSTPGPRLRRLPAGSFP